MDSVQRTVIGLLEPGGDERYRLSADALVVIHRELGGALKKSDAKAEISALLRLVAALGGRLKSPRAAASLVKLLNHIPMAMAIIHEEFTQSRQRKLQVLAEGDPATVAEIALPLRPPPLPKIGPTAEVPRRAWSTLATEIVEIDTTRPDLISSGARSVSR